MENCFFDLYNWVGRQTRKRPGFYLSDIATGSDFRCFTLTHDNGDEQYVVERRGVDGIAVSSLTMSTRGRICQNQVHKQVGLVQNDVNAFLSGDHKNYAPKAARKAPARYPDYKFYM